MSTTINVTVGDGGLPERNRQQTAANRQAYVQGKASEQAAQTGLERRAADRTAAGLDPATGRILVPSSGGGFRRLDQQPAANRRPGGDIGFVLAPGRTIFPVSGPFGDFRYPGWPFSFQSVGINGLSRGYTNTLWGLRAGWFINVPDSYSKYPGDGLPIPSTEFDQCIRVDGPLYPFPSPVAGGGGYQTRARTERIDFCGSQPGLYNLDTIGGFTIGHTIADGSNLKFQRIDPTDFGSVLAPFPLESTHRLTRSRTPLGVTLEAIVRLGAGPSTEDNGSNAFSVYVQNAPGGGLGFYIDQNGGNLILNGSDAISNVAGGTDLHIAQVVSSNSDKLYANGRLVAEFSDSGILNFPRSSGPMYCEVSLFDNSSQVFREVNPFPDPRYWESWPEFSTTHNGPSILKGVRYTERALYTGTSFTPPTSLTQLA